MARKKSKSRARRSEFWWEMIGLYLLKLFVAMPLMLVFFWKPIMRFISSGDLNDLLLIRVEEITMIEVLGLSVGIFLYLLFEIEGIYVTVRRFHDRNMSGWWIVLFWIFFWVFPVISWLIRFVILYLMDGTPGPNDYGPDPRGRGEQPRQPVAYPRQMPRVVIKTVPVTLSPQTRLSNLEQMLEKGLISEEEYEKKRRTILEQI